MKYLRDGNSLCITEKSDFGNPSYSKHSETNCYETAHKNPFQPITLVVDRENKCLTVAYLTPKPEEYTNDDPIMDGKAHISDNGECSHLYHNVNDQDVKDIKTYSSESRG